MVAVVGGINGGTRNLGRREEAWSSVNDLSESFDYSQTLERRADGRNGQVVNGSPPRYLGSRDISLRGLPTCRLHGTLGKQSPMLLNHDCTGRLWHVGEKETESHFYN